MVQYPKQNRTSLAGLATTILDPSVHPLIVNRLHYEVEGWFGDVARYDVPVLPDGSVQVRV